MGYYITTDNSSITILKANLPRFFEIVSNLMTPDSIRKYSQDGLYTNSDQECHYSWIDTNEVIRAVEEKSPIAIFAAWRYNAYVVEDTDSLIRFHFSTFDTQKMGDEEILFSAIAPVVENDSYIEVRGEDGSRWQWSWMNGKFFAADEIQVSYGTPREVTVDTAKDNW